MAELAGYGGQFKLHATPSTAVSAVVTVITGMNNWTVNYNADALEVTAFEDSGVRMYIAGQTGWTATATGNYSSTLSYNATYKPGNDYTAKFDMGSSKELLGNVILTGVSFGAPVDGIITVGFDFQGTGALTIG